MNDLIEALKQLGPTRSRRLVEHLTNKHGLKPENARQRLSRARDPVMRYPLALLPRKEAFYYLKDQRNSEQFWEHLLADLRETGAVYGAAIDALSAKGGIVPIDEFATISGAPLRLKKTNPSVRRRRTLGRTSRDGGKRTP